MIKYCLSLPVHVLFAATILFSGANSWSMSCSHDLLPSIGPLLFSRDLDIVEKFFSEVKGLNNEDLIQSILKSDVRRVFFRLQALTKLYSRSKQNHDIFKKFKKIFKEVEDGIGKIDFFEGLSNGSEAIDHPKLARHLKEKIELSREVLIKLLKSNGLLTNPSQAIRNIKDELAGVKYWGGSSSTPDREFLRNTIIARTLRLSQRVKDNEFDNEDIELGLHELRRQLRWIIIFVQALDGAAVWTMETKLSKPVKNWYSELSEMNDNLLESGYLSISEASVAQPLVFPHQMGAIITELVRKIGDIKDHAEIEVEIGGILREMGTSEKDIKKIITQLDGNDGSTQVIDHQGLSREYQSQLLESDLLGQFAKWIRKQSKSSVK